MPVYYLPYVIADPDTLNALVKRGYVEFRGNQIGFMWTDKGLSAYKEFTQNLANLG